MTTNFIGTLLTNSPTYTVTSGFSTLLYDAYGAQTVSVSSGGSLSLVGAMGSNTIRLHGNADAWQVMRSGSTTIFITNGDRVEIPAIVEQQTISFADQSAALRIETSGNVPVLKLGTQSIGTTASAITAWSGANPDDPVESPVLAPWTLVMKNGSRTLVSDGSASGTHETDVPGSFGSSYLTNPDLSKALAYGSGQGIWSIASSSSNLKLTDVDFQSFGYPALSVISLGDKIAFIREYAGTAVITDGVTANVSDLDFGIANQYMKNFKLDIEGNIWTPANTAPYGDELGKIYITSGALQSDVVKDINPGVPSALNYGQLDGTFLPNGSFIFSANDGVHGFEPWVSDGTDLGTFLLSDLNYSEGSNPSQFTQFGNTVAFVASVYGPRIIGITDGSIEGTSWIEVVPSWGWGVEPTILGVAGDLLYFKASDDQGLGIFSAEQDPTNAGFLINRLATVSNEANLIAMTDQIAYFSASDSEHGKELWALPLGESGTFGLVEDILPGSGSSLAGYNQQQFLVGDKLAFTAYTTAARQSFYLSDGTSSGTVKLSDAVPSAHVTIGNNLYFTDTSGTYMVDTVPSEVVASRIGEASSVLQSDADQAYFLTNQDLYVIEVGESTPTLLAEGVAKVKVFQENALYFIQQGSGGVLSLWYSDGTSNGTRYIEDLPTNYLFGYDLDNAVAIRTIGVNDLAL